MNHYHFVTRWRMQGDIEKVYDLLSRPLDYPNWWHGSKLRVKELEPPDERGMNQVVRFEVKGQLPYTLGWQSKATELNRPHGFKIESTGDLIGSGMWTFEQDGPWVNMSFDWNVSAHKSLLRYFSFVLKPLFLWNHNRIMKTWEESLQTELSQHQRRLSLTFLS